ncbi:unnamed protein product [Brachionus calyciflorus]|uniref:Uncharacterized protein n=1 Tax=Brachionus calyciflorus TaxID=104777 RepID=A0A814L8P7_9BILA|nr:unnamed protein product [Brachionus calyciflorus]
MNGFEDWTSSNENDESEAIIARSQEIRNMIENSHKQLKQILKRLKSVEKTIEKIPIGKTVYIKCEG